MSRNEMYRRMLTHAMKIMLNYFNNAFLEFEIPKLYRMKVRTFFAFWVSACDLAAVTLPVTEDNIFLVHP